MAVTGQQLTTMVQTRLAGLAGAFNNQQLLDLVNEGKDELWAVMVTSAGDYFAQSSIPNTTTPASVNTFLPLTTSSRQYTLPADCLRPRLIEVTAPTGYEFITFEYRELSHPEFQTQRRLATANGPAAGTSGGVSIYYYTIVGKNTLLMAAFPEVAFTLNIWYVRSLPDLSAGTSLDEMVAPFQKHIVAYAVKLVQAIKGDPSAWQIWKEEWRQQIILMLEAAGPRSSTNPIFVAGFLE